MTVLSNAGDCISVSEERLLPLAQTAWAADWKLPEEEEAWRDLEGPRQTGLAESQPPALVSA